MSLFSDFEVLKLNISFSDCLTFNFFSTYICIKKPAIFEKIMYVAKPAGNDNVKNPNITGIIHNIILFVCSCLASELLNIETFCCAKVVPATINGSNIANKPPACWTGFTRSIPKKKLSNGTLFITGFHEYR